MTEQTPKGFAIHTPESTDGLAKELLQTSTKKYGFLPNFIAIAGEAPSVIESYDYLTSKFEDTTLSAAERQVVFLAASVENGCDFCVPAHTAAVEKDSSIDDEIAEKLRNQQPIDDSKLQALAEYTRELMHTKGNVSKQQLQTFLDAGYDRQQALEVMVGVAAKTVSNFVNNLVETPLNKELESFAWENKGTKRKAA